jgi:hypothetical protein
MALSAITKRFQIFYESQNITVSLQTKKLPEEGPQ